MIVKYIPYLYLLLQIFAAEIVFLIKAEKRNYFWIRLIASFGVAGIICYGLKFVSFLGWFIFLIPLMLSGVALFISYRISAFHAGLFAVIAHALQNCAYSIGQLILAPFGRIDMLVVELVSLGLLALILVACWFMFARNLKIKSMLGFKNVTTLIIAIVVLACVTVLHSFFNYQTAEIIGRVFLVLSTILAIFMLFGISERSRLNKEKAELENILRREARLHRLSKESIEIINMKCHDLKHRISLMRSGEIKGSDDLEEIENAVAIYDGFIQTGNEDLNLVIAEKSLFCKKYGVQLSCIIDGRKLSFMASSDIYSLFGNAFDNAVESLKNVEDKDRRLISLNVQVRGNFLGISMENYCNKELEFVDDLPKTTKGEEYYHGFGMKSMRYITEKYG
ncbi:MAG: sensor histidine kinase, partial [Clostridia bacterium]|nr:sensor histidine kinase [Clostridia bacterium]